MQVLHQCFYETYAADIAMLFFKLFHAAEFQPGAALGFCWRQPRLDELRNLLIKVEAKFFF